LAVWLSRSQRGIIAHPPTAFPAGASLSPVGQGLLLLALLHLHERWHHFYSHCVVACWRCAPLLLGLGLFLFLFAADADEAQDDRVVVGRQAYHIAVIEEVDFAFRHSLPLLRAPSPH
jgi:hypothetical protein